MIAKVLFGNPVAAESFATASVNGAEGVVEQACSGHGE